MHVSRYNESGNNLSGLIWQVIAESLSEEEIAGLKEMFMSMDTDNSGAITFEELKAGLKRYGSNLKDIEIRDLMEAVINLAFVKSFFSLVFYNLSTVLVFVGPSCLLLFDILLSFS